MEDVRVTGSTFPRRLGHEWHVTLLALAVPMPAVVLSLWLLVRTGAVNATPALWTGFGIVVAIWLAGAWMLRRTVARPLQNLANTIASLREGDYTMRIRDARPDDSLGLAVIETNALGDLLRDNRLAEMEATALLRTVMSEIDVAIFVFDDGGCLQLINRAGERLLAEPAERLLGREAAALKLANVLTGEAPRVEDVAWPGASGRWGVRRTRVRQAGRSHTLLVLTDLSRTLREEQLATWQRIVRVLSHEINNSMAPIQSIAQTLRGLVVRDPPPDDFRGDLERGLSVIASRSESLARLMSSYARLAKLPPPNRRDVDVNSWVARVATLETRVPVTVEAGAPFLIAADPDQLDQLLINLVQNAADATLEAQSARYADDRAAPTGEVRVIWGAHDGSVLVRVIDEGPGLAGKASLFVPFYTTKQHGSGIGLVLSRQIAELHGGSLTLTDRIDRRGCVATVTLPIGRALTRPGTLDSRL